MKKTACALFLSAGMFFLAIILTAGEVMPIRDCVGLSEVVIDDAAILINVEDGAVVKVGASANAIVRGYETKCRIENNGGSVRFEDPAPSEPKLWLDADNTARYQISTNASGVGEYRVVDGVSYPVVMKWFDTRATQDDYYAWEWRCYGTSPAGGNSYNSSMNRLYPVLMTNGYDGVRSYMSFKNESQCVRAQLYAAKAESPGYERGIPARFAIMVYGSHHGGSAGLLATEDGRFKRQESPTAASATLDDPIMLDNGFDVWMNGRKVEENATQKLSGEWDIVSIDLTKNGEASKIIGLGFAQNYSSDGGGALYAEVLLFENVLSDGARIAQERRLAAKWMLADKYRGSCPSQVTLAGRGSLVVANELEIGGGFVSGSVVLDGGKIVQKGYAMPVVTEDDVKAIPGRIGWFNPADEDLIDFRGGEKSPNEVLRLYDHVEGRSGSIWLNDSFGGDGADRAPWLNRSVRALGSVSKWLDYADPNPSDTTGNYLKFRNSQGDTTLSVRTVFILSDSTRGGGSPVLDTSTGQKIKARINRAASYHVWPEGTDETVTKGKTYLNGKEVDGSAVGFTGGPELFEFNTTEMLDVGFLGSFQNSKNSGAAEILGESLFFNSVLGEEDRRKVETYLMANWLGHLPDGCMSLASVRMSGTQGAYTGSAVALPCEGDFSGELNLTDDSLSFVMAGSRVANAIKYPQASVSLPSAVTVSVKIDDHVAGGEYTLIEAGALPEDVEWTLQLVGDKAQRYAQRCHLVKAISGKLVLKVDASGLIMIFR